MTWEGLLPDVVIWKSKRRFWSRIPHLTCFPEESKVPDFRIRPATSADLSRLTEIYNHYVLNTPVTFDVEPYTVDQRAFWFSQFGPTGCHRLLVAEDDRTVIGYAGTTGFRPKAAYETTVESTIYCAPESTGKGVGRRLYASLFECLRGEDVHRLVAGYTVPNAASAALHHCLGFKSIGVFTEVGRKFGKYWNVCWMERHIDPAGDQ